MEQLKKELIGTKKIIKDIITSNLIIYPISGRLLDLIQVPDNIFCLKLRGDGFAINIIKGRLVLPVDEVIKSFQIKNI